MAEWTKSESSASRLQCRNDLGQVVTYQAEPHVLCILLYHWKKEKIVSVDIIVQLHAIKYLKA